MPNIKDKIGLNELYESKKEALFIKIIKYF